MFEADDGSHRRRTSRSLLLPRTAAVQFAAFTLDLDGCSLSRTDGSDIALTHNEFALLREFVRHPGRVLSRAYLLDALVGKRAGPFDRGVDMLVGRLRRKIEPDRSAQSIVTVQGSGYKFAAQVRQQAGIMRRRYPDGAAAGPPDGAPAPKARERHQIIALAAELTPAPGGRLPVDPEDLRGVVDVFRHSAAEAFARYGSRSARAAAARSSPISATRWRRRMTPSARCERRSRSNASTEIRQERRQMRASALRPHRARARAVMVEATGEAGKRPIPARVKGLADPGTVLVTANVQRQTAGLFVAEDRGACELNGVPALVTLYRIVRASGGRRAGCALSPRSLGARRSSNCCAGAGSRPRVGAGQLTLIVGEPGIGKSRLVEEFRATLGEMPHTFVELSSSQMLQNTPLHPIAEWAASASVRVSQPTGASLT